MIRSLLRKELRDQRPFLALMVVLELLDLLSALFTGDFARQPMAFDFFEGYSRMGMVALLVIAFALGTGLLTREREERTLEFLDALPIGRSPLFLMKIAVAWGVLMSGPVLELLVLLLRQALYRSSVDSGWYLGLLVTGALLQGAVIYVGLALGVVLSFAGRLSWMLFGLLAIVVYLLTRQLPALSVLDPTAIAIADFEGSHWRIPLSGVALHLGLSTAGLLLALGLFSGFWDRPLRRLWGLMSGAAATPIAAITTVIGFILLALLFGGEDAKAPAEPGALFWPDAKPGRFSSQRYDFLYPSALAESAAPLFERGDAVWRDVGEVLGGAPEGRIPVDLTGSARHTAGITFWNAVRMNLSTSEPPEELLATLAHETTHVFASLTVGAEHADRLGQLRTFGEGLARYVEHQLFPELGVDDQGRAVAAILHERKQLRVDDLIDASALQAAQDPDVVYPFGEMLVERLVARYGKEAPRRLLEAIGREDAPEDLAPLTVWQDAFQSAGFELPRVLYDLQAALARERTRPGAPPANLPRPKPVLEEGEEEDRLWIRAVLSAPPPEGWWVVCRFRGIETTSFTEYDGPYTMELDQGCLRHRGDVERRTLWVQLGLMAPGGYTVYEPWVSFPVD